MPCAQKRIAISNFDEVIRQTLSRTSHSSLHGAQLSVRWLLRLHTISHTVQRYKRSACKLEVTGCTWAQCTFSPPAAPRQMLHECAASRDGQPMRPLQQSHSVAVSVETSDCKRSNGLGSSGGPLTDPTAPPQMHLALILRKSQHAPGGPLWRRPNRTHSRKTS